MLFGFLNANDSHDRQRCLWRLLLNTEIQKYCFM